jgi:hypothetical protein
VELKISFMVSNTIFFFVSRVKKKKKKGKRKKEIVLFSDKDVGV